MKILVHRRPPASVFWDPHQIFIISKIFIILPFFIEKCKKKKKNSDKKRFKNLKISNLFRFLFFLKPLLKIGKTVLQFVLWRAAKRPRRLRRKGCKQTSNIPTPLLSLFSHLKIQTRTLVCADLLFNFFYNICNRKKTLILRFTT